MELETCNQYKIAFKGLEDGNHEFKLMIDKGFIELFEIKEIDDINVGVTILMIKRDIMLELEIAAEGTVTVPCDRCLELFALKTSFENKLIVKTNAAKTEMIDECLIHLSPKTDLLDLSQYLYESLIISLPIKKTHPENECDKEMIKRLKPNKTNKIKNDSDPRWDALKNIQF
jgi:uncharacterized metal-binding protein YceD (DUF177 family)